MRIDEDGADVERVRGGCAKRGEQVFRGSNVRTMRGRAWVLRDGIKTVPLKWHCRWGCATSVTLRDFDF
jgi:hypothetical protein